MKTLIDFFCGAGGMGLGFKNAGFNIIQALDFDKYAVESYRVNVGEHVHQRDISTIPGPAKSYADVWTFGFPCQDLSIAGKQAGLFEGKRSGLFFEIMRLLQETKDQKPENLPKVIMAENVKGLKPYLPVLEQEYAKVGYKMYVTLFNSKYWGVPQSRERYFVVGIREDLPQTFQFPEQQTNFIPKLSSVLENEVDDKYYIADEKAQKIIEQALLRLESLGKVHPVLTPDRIERRQQGRRAKEEEDPMFTITAQDLHGVIINQEIAATAEEPQINVVGRLDIRVQKDQQARVYSPEGLALTATAVQGGHHHIKILQHISKETGLLNQDGIGKTLMVSGKGSSHSKKHNYEYMVTDSFRVRKLTPREYARLQGFPDSFQFVCSDTQLYKQFGNAVTVNVAEAIATSIKTYLEGII